MTVGIHAFGAYIPKARLQREVMARAYSWFNPSLASLGQGERAIANWDEDALTMAVEAARNALTPQQYRQIDGLYLASTSLPFQDRQNAGIAAEAMHLGNDLHTMDITGSQRAGTSALLTALQIAVGNRRNTLVIGGEKRQTKASSPLQLTAGDGGTALLVGPGEGVAALVGYATQSVDFVDHYRGQNQPFDYVWEERWVRDEGFLKIVPNAVRQALSNGQVAASEIDHFCFPSPAKRVAGMLAKTLGISDSAVRDNLQGRTGEAGSIHALLMLTHALEEATPGQLILIAGFGQGCDALLFRTTEQLLTQRPMKDLKQLLSAGCPNENYHRYLAINDLVTIEQGLRAEVDKQTGLTTLYRNREMLLGLIGGRCETCDTLQYPKSNLCVNPDCGALNTQTDHSFSNMPCKVNSYTADRLTYSPDPPAYYGMVQFDQGGRAMLDFTDIFSDSELSVGQAMRLMFRVKDYDVARGFRRYFWKAVPIDNAFDNNGKP